MAITKKIEIDGQEIRFRASAAIPRMYRNMFGRGCVQGYHTAGRYGEGE